MAISGVGSNYNNMYEGTYAAQKAETKESASAQAGKALVQSPCRWMWSCALWGI
ncbi:MAG: hypothetical protein NC094_06780 [Bacteroidales bacterium]|nr:hypothetical protein [Lachnoclostridium sp.]MCM1384747.1 hypothetical protein [Lachnoclostridium sp.]MCM1465107.1 hypothetical protein [Bacteroidales bacterium]